MYRLSAKLRIAIGLTLLSSSVLLLSRTLKIGPDEDLARVAGRRQLAEILALHSSVLLNRNELTSLRQSLSSFLSHHREVRSVVLRQQDAEEVLRVESLHPDNLHKSLNDEEAVVISFPLLAEGREWGKVDITFEPLHPPGLLATVRHPFMQWIAVVSLTNLLLFLFYLKRTLQHLDPSRVVPERVRSALDTIAEGLVVIDKRERIVLANKAFAAAVGTPAAELVGRSLARFSWQDGTGNALGQARPWLETPVQGKNACRVANVRLVRNTGEARCYVVNAAPILTDDGARRGTLVSFEDVTELEERRSELNRTMEVLRTSRDEVRRQNEELRQLATRDPLTGCQNRRAFYQALETQWNAAGRSGNSLGLVIVDVDHFKKINDTHGHSAGDLVLQQVAAALREAVRSSDLVCRYGGEEFCVLLPHVTLEQAVDAAEHLRKTVQSVAVSGIPVTASFGVTCSSLGAGGPQALIDQADKSLYVAKRQGRNRVVAWDPASESNAAEQVAEAPASSREGSPQEVVEIPYQAVSALMSALTFRDSQTAAHARRVADLCVAVAARTMSARETYVLETAALLHDIGKIGVPDNILLKPGPLTAEEWKTMRIHDRMGVEIIASAFACPVLTEIVEHHHLPFSSGDVVQFPQGKTIPFGARLLSIADAYDSMVSDRVYRKGRSSEQAFAELRRCAGKQFDPEVVEQFIDVVQKLPQANEHSLEDVSREAAVLIGESMERLASSLDNLDLPGLTVLAQRLQHTAKKHRIAELAETAAELERAAKSDPDLQQIATLTKEVMGLCRATQSVFTTSRLADSRVNAQTPVTNAQ